MTPLLKDIKKSIEKKFDRISARFWFWLIKRLPKKLVFLCALEVLDNEKIPADIKVLEALLRWYKENC